MSTEPTILISGTDPDLPQNVPPGLKRYTGFREMARGGSGLLRSCFDPITGRTVAVKSLLPETKKDRGERRRLLREARVTAQLQHPNTPPVYDIGDDDDEGIYFIMKRISGENLFEVLKRIARGDERTIASFPITRRLEILEGTARRSPTATSAASSTATSSQRTSGSATSAKSCCWTGARRRSGGTPTTTCRFGKAFCSRESTRTTTARRKSA